MVREKTGVSCRKGLWEVAACIVSRGKVSIRSAGCRMLCGFGGDDASRRARVEGESSAWYQAS